MVDARDLELRQGLHEWRRLLTPAVVSAAAAAIVCATAWGGASHDLQATADELTRMRDRNDAIDGRLQKVEQQTPAVIARLDDLKSQVQAMDAKLDRLATR